MINNLYHYKAKVIRVIDGDTIEVLIDLGFKSFLKDKLRLARIDAYETRLGQGRDELHKAKGLEAKQWLKMYFEKHDNVYITTSKGGKYGRWIAEVYVEENDTLININDLIVEKGYDKNLSKTSEIQGKEKTN